MLVAIVFGAYGAGSRRLAHLCPGEHEGLDLPLDGLIKRFDQPDAEFVSALPDDHRHVNQTGLLNLHSQSVRHSAAGTQAKPRAVPVQITDDSVHDFVPRTMRNTAAQNASLALCGATISVLLGS